MQQPTDPYELLYPVLETKCAELRIFDSARLSPEELWRYCLKNIWQNHDIENLNLHEKVRDIMRVRLSDYVAFSQLEGFKVDDWFAEAATDEWQELLKPSPKDKKRFDTQ